MAIRIRGSRARAGLYENRLGDGLLGYSDEQALEQYEGFGNGAAELKNAINAANGGTLAMALTEDAAKVLAFLAYHWLDYYGDQGHNDYEDAKAEARNRAGLCQRILAELKLQGVVYVETRAAVVWS
jgi:hypothetical protein